MQDERPKLDPELSGIEARLAALTPVANIDRDLLMFAAGQRDGARRVRTINRLLAATSLLCGGLAAAVLAMPRGPLEPVAAGVPEASGAQNAGRAGKPQPSSAGRPTGRLAESSLAAIDGTTNYRLLQTLAYGSERPIDQRPPRGSSQPADDKPSPPSDSRTLLKRYLESKPGRL